MNFFEYSLCTELNRLFNVTINDISVIYVTAHRCADGLKKLDLRSGSKRHRHFIGFFNVPVQAPTRDHPLDQPTDPVELPVVEQPLPVEEHPVPAPPAAEAGDFLSSLRSFGGGIVIKGREILSVGLEGVRSVPQVVDRVVTKVQDAFSYVWECAVCIGECICNTVSSVVGSLLGSSPAPEATPDSCGGG